MQLSLGRLAPGRERRPTRHRDTYSPGVPFAAPTADQSVAELKSQIELERNGDPFLVHRNDDGTQVLTALAGRERVSVGRDEDADVRIDGDDAVSRVHAELTLLSGAWVVADDGLSRNGTFVNGERLAARRRLSDRDLILVGGSGVLFRDPAAKTPADATVGVGPGATAPPLGETQRRVLVALCRPLGSERSFAATPASNRAIADELVITVGAVKANLRVLFSKFGVEDEPQNRKRAALAECALSTGAVLPGELDQP